MDNEKEAFRSFFKTTVVCHGITMYWKQTVHKETERDRERTLERSLTDSDLLYKNLAYLYWSANEQLALQLLLRRLSQVCESVWIHACRCVYAKAARGFTLFAYYADFRQTGSAGAPDLVGMPASSSRLAATLDSVYRKSAASEAWLGVITFLPPLWEKWISPLIHLEKKEYRYWKGSIRLLNKKGITCNRKYKWSIINGWMVRRYMESKYENKAKLL